MNKEFSKERKEHPSLSDKTVKQIVKDHERKREMKHKEHKSQQGSQYESLSELHEKHPTKHDVNSHHENKEDNYKHPHDHDDADCRM